MVYNSLGVPSPVVLNPVAEITASTMLLTWSENTNDDFRMFKVFRSLAEGVTESSQQLATIYQDTTTSYLVSSLQENKGYYFRVFTYDIFGHSSGSNEVMAMTLNVAPHASTLQLCASPPRTESSIPLCWTRNTDHDFNSYRLYRLLTADVDTNSTLIFETQDDGATAYTDTGLVANTEYYYRLYVYDTGGIASGSNTAAIATLWRVFFEDHFDGSSVDPGKWNTSLATSGYRWCAPSLGWSWDFGSWQDVSVQSCFGYLQLPPYGTVVVSDGRVTLASSSISCFPFLWAGEPSRPSPFPAYGDFILEFRAKYETLGPRGAGVRITDWDYTDPVGTNSPGQPFILFLGGAADHVTLLTPGGDVAIGNPLATHLYRVECIGGAYTYLVDGAVVKQLEETLRPSAIWFGNPIVTTPGTWSSFSIDYFEVRFPLSANNSETVK
jgi:hypothetical protein